MTNYIRLSADAKTAKLVKMRAVTYIMNSFTLMSVHTYNHIIKTNQQRFASRSIKLTFVSR